MKNKAYSLEGEVSSELKVYRKDQEKYSKRPFEVVTISKLLKSIHKASVVYLGDFHSFDQSSRNLERLLRELTIKHRQLALGVEFVNQEDQNIIEHYLAGFITEYEFLEMINYHDSWRFPWHHYKIFFDLAKKEKLQIIALNTVGTLKERDKKAAKKIDYFIKNHQGSQLLVLFGEYHISSNKLPSFVNKNISQVIIHQNLDEVYFKLLKTGGAGPKAIVQFNEMEFSLQSSVPWVKYESMIYWYENLCEDPDFDIHESAIEAGGASFNSNVPENFVYLVKKIAEALKVEINLSHIDDFNLYDHHQLKYILRKIEKIKPPQLKHFYASLINKGNSFKLPFGNTYFCSSYSINRISFLAGMHLQELSLSSDKTHSEILSKNSQTQKFIFLLYQHTVAYSASKIINPYRKCDLVTDLNEQYLNNKTSPELKLTISLIELLLSRKDINFALKGKKLSSIFFSAKKIGYIIGDILYDEFYSKSSNDFSKIQKILFSPNYDTSGLEKLFSVLMEKIDLEKTKKRLF